MVPKLIFALVISFLLSTSAKAQEAEVLACKEISTLALVAEKAIKDNDMTGVYAAIQAGDCISIPKQAITISNALGHITYVNKIDINKKSYNVHRLQFTDLPALYFLEVNHNA